MNQIIDINTFKIDHDFYGSISLLASIKSFDLQAVRTRYIASRKSGKQRVGSVNRREKATGGIASLSIKKGIVEKQQILAHMMEPRAIDYRDGSAILGTDRKVWVIVEHEVYELRHDWFSYIHTAVFSPFEGNKILVACSGYDMILEIDYLSGKTAFEWLSWEHGYAQSYDASTDSFYTLTRDEKSYRRLQKEGEKAILINNPGNDSLPTARRAAFINTVAYHPEDRDKIFATFFHKGAMLEISRKNGSSHVLIEGMKSPHGSRLEDGLHFATSTATGEVIIRKDNTITKFDFSQLPGKANGMEGLEWLQNSIKVDDIFITIDSNRNSFIIFHPGKKLMDIIPFDANWAIQDMVFTPDIKPELLEKISTYNFE